MCNLRRILDPEQSSTFRERSICYLHYDGDDDLEKPVTMWVIADFNSSKGIELAREAVAFISDDQSSSTRLAFMENAQTQSPLGKVLAAACNVETRRSRVPGFLKCVCYRIRLIFVHVISLVALFCDISLAHRSLLSNDSTIAAMQQDQGWLEMVVLQAEESSLNAKAFQSLLRDENVVAMVRSRLPVISRNASVSSTMKFHNYFDAHAD